MENVTKAQFGKQQWPPPSLILDNFNVIIDRNNFQQTGSNKEIMRFR